MINVLLNSFRQHPSFIILRRISHSTQKGRKADKEGRRGAACEVERKIGRETDES